MTLKKNSRVIIDAQTEFQPLICRLRRMGLSEAQARSRIEDATRFLCLCALNPKSCFVPPEKIDETWHEMLQFTHLYQKFCEKSLGSYIHHFPHELLPSFSPGSCCAGATLEAINSARFPEASEKEIKIRTLKKARSIFGRLSKNWRFNLN